MKFCLGNFKPKGNPSPAKDVNHKTVFYIIEIKSIITDLQLMMVSETVI